MYRNIVFAASVFVMMMLLELPSLALSNSNDQVNEDMHSIHHFFDDPGVDFSFGHEITITKDDGTYKDKFNPSLLCYIVYCPANNRRLFVQVRRSQHIIQTYTYLYDKAFPDEPYKQPQLSFEQIDKIANIDIYRLASYLFINGNYIVLSDISEKIGSNCMYISYSYIDINTQFSLGRIDIAINIYTGLIEGFNNNVYAIKDKQLSRTRESILQLIYSQAAHFLKAEVKDITLVHEERWDEHDEKLNAFVRAYHWAFSGNHTENGNQQQVAYFDVNAENGAIMGQAEIPLVSMPSNVRSPEKLTQIGKRVLSDHGIVSDRWPVWSKDQSRIYLITNRAHRGAPCWDRLHASAYIDLKTGEIRWIDPGFLTKFLSRFGPENEQINKLSIVDSPPVLIEELTYRVRTYQLLTGTVDSIDEIKPDKTVFVSSTFRWLTIHSDFPPEKGVDLYFTHYDEKTGGLSLGQRVTTDGASKILPLLTSDGKTLYYIIEKWEEIPGKHIGFYSYLYMVTSNDQWHTSSKPIQLAKQLPRISRLSLFPDEKQLLLQTNNGVFTLSIANTKVTEIPLSNLYDQELQRWLLVRDAAIDSNGQQIVFSGLILKDKPQAIIQLSDDDEERITSYIYTCDLEGNNLQRITPIDEKVIEPAVFANTDAVKIAREYWDRINRQLVNHNIGNEDKR